MTHDEPSTFFADEIIGRASLLDQVTARLREGDRWLTLEGPSGIGKTRLAVELARRIDLTDRGDGICFCALTAIHTLGELADALARSLELDVGDPMELGRALAARGRMLLVLDDLDPDIGAVPLQRWLADAPEARFLVTARRRLEGLLERAIEVGPLAPPTTDAPDVVRASAAGQLFLARAARSGHVVADEDLSRVAAIARSLEGIPLAIEFAAARGDALHALAEELTHAPQEGHGGRLNRVVAWSWSRLDEAERTALARLSVFDAPFDAKAAAAVLGHGAALLTGLHGRSFLRAFSEPRAGEDRFSLYDVVRAFAGAALDGEERVAALAAHARHYGALARHLRATLEVRYEPHTEALVAVEAPHFMAAARAGATVGEPAAAAEAGLALEGRLVTTGRFDEALALARAVVDAADAASDASLRTRALSMRGEVQRRRALPAAAQDHAAALALAPSDPGLVAHVRRCLGVVARDLGDFVRADAELTAARDLLDATSAPRERALVELALSGLRRREDDAERAHAHAEAALVMGRDARDPLLEGRALVALGLLRDDDGALEEALDLVEAAISLLSARGDRWMEEIARNAAGLLHAELGRPAEARAFCDEAVEICEDSGFAAGLAVVKGNLGWLEYREERRDRAEARFRESVAMARTVGFRFAEALYGASLGAMEASCDRIDEATRSFSEASAAADACLSPGLHLVIATLRGFLDLARARAAEAPLDVAAHTEQARERLARARRAARPDGDLRTVLRALAQALSGTRPPPPRPIELQIDVTTQNVFLGELRIALGRHPSLFRLVDQLVTAGKPLLVEDLFAAGWPGERIGRRSARNRVHVGLSTLRKLGLAGVLVLSDEGYQIAPHVRRSRR